MTDLHALIIPGVDEGSGSLGLSLKTLKPAYDLAVTAASAIPHLCGEIALDCRQTTVSARVSNAHKNTDLVFISSSAGKPTDNTDHKKSRFDVGGGNK
jgi:tyrosine-protein phosphatase YwqE